MREKLCVYTCITGNYDNLHEIEHPEKNIDYYCFTNNKTLKSKTWKIIRIKNGSLDNCRLARKIKILGHPLINNHYDISVWTDADVIWQKPISLFVKTYLKSNPLAIFKHHSRTNIHDEAIICLRLRKDNKEAIQKTLEFYESINYPDNNGLCESTVFIRKLNDPKAIETMQIWFDMVKNYSRRDQLSFNYAIWKTQLKITTIDLNVWHNTWFKTIKHNPNQTIQDCHIYYGNPDHNFNINRYYIYPYIQQKNTYKVDIVIPYDTKEIEFSPTNITSIKFQEISISPNPNKVIVHGDTLSIFCHDHGVIRVYGNYQKNQKLSFSITMKHPTPAEINQLIEYQWIQNSNLLNDISRLKQVESENKQLLITNTKLRNDLQSILNSKSWKTIQKIRKILHF